MPIKDDFPYLAQYQNIIIGPPIWWGIQPRLISSTIDALNLNGQHLATFATSDGSNYDRSQSYVERAVKENGYDVQLNRGQILNRTSQVDAWLNSLNLA